MGNAPAAGREIRKVEGFKMISREIEKRTEFPFPVVFRHSQGKYTKKRVLYLVLFFLVLVMFMT
jgi:hypothetical protein